MEYQHAFKEYVTSGAFKLSLSRSQISALAMISEVGEACMGGHTCISLHRKGLVTTIRAADGKLEYRLSEAGVYALKMARIADLTQGAPDPVADEIAALRRQLNETRIASQQVAEDNHNLRARLDRVRRQLVNITRVLRGRPEIKKPIITLRDKTPERSISKMMEDAQELYRVLEVTPTASQCPPATPDSKPSAV